MRWRDLRALLRIMIGASGCRFNDRTLVRIYYDFTVIAISRNGEAEKSNFENSYGFKQYILVFVEFYKWAFTSQAEHIRRANETAERENIVGAEIPRNE